MDTASSCIRLVGGHPALDLANTVSGRRGGRGEDRLADAAILLDWAGRAGIAGPEAIAAWRQAPPQTLATTLDQVRALREAVYRAFAALGEGAPPPAEDLHSIASLARQAAAARQLCPEAGGFAWRWQEPGPPEALAQRLAHAAAELLTSPALPRVRECQGRHCGWLFLDTSRAGRRRWCDDGDCGVASRVRQFRARRYSSSS